MKKLFLAFLATALITGTSCRASNDGSQAKNSMVTLNITVELDKQVLGSYIIEADINESLASVEKRLLKEVSDHKNIIIDLGDKLHAFAVGMPFEQIYPSKQKSGYPVARCIADPQTLIFNLDKESNEHNGKIDIHWCGGGSVSDLLKAPQNSRKRLRDRIGNGDFLDELMKAHPKRSPSNNQPLPIDNNDINSTHSTILDVTFSPKKFLYFWGEEEYRQSLGFIGSGKNTKLNAIYHFLHDHENVKKAGASNVIVEYACPEVVRRTSATQRNEVSLVEHHMRWIEITSDNEKTIQQTIPDERSAKNIMFRVSFTPSYTKGKIAVGGIAFCILLGLAYAAWYGYERYYTKAKKPRTRGISPRRR